jgi:hypothetical protein
MVAGLRDAGSPSSSFDATLSSLRGPSRFASSTFGRGRAAGLSAALCHAWRLNTSVEHGRGTTSHPPCIHFAENALVVERHRRWVEVALAAFDGIGEAPGPHGGRERGLHLNFSRSIRA